METLNWYSALSKPSWAPPAYLFGPVWTFLYFVIFATYSWATYLAFKGKMKYSILLPFFLNAVFNALFTPMQFGLKNNPLALIDIILVLLTLVWSMIAVWKYEKRIAIANIPYLFWVAFATTLQISITVLNW